MFMNNPQSDSSATRPTDPDLKWTGWALDALRETVEIDLRAKRVVERQMAIPGEAAPDAAVVQARLSRSVRLSIAMTERIRTDYLMRRDGRTKSGEQERRRKRREQAPDLVAAAAALPGDAEDAERVRSMVREDLVEDEILDVQIDTLSPEEFVRAVCRKIGLPPDPSWVPRGWEEVGEVAPAATAERRSAESWPRPSDESDAGRVLPKPWRPDSS
jgi:hypothetical protein